MTHVLGVDHRPYAKIGHLDGWKECIVTFCLITNSNIKVRMGSKTHVKLTQNCTDKVMKRKIFKI